jgi:hypothetical protein
MNVRHRSMQPEDIPECVQLLMSHPVIGPRYEPVIEHLPEVWLRLLGSDATGSALFYADDGPRPPICCLGFTVIVRDDFIRELKTPPHFWTGPEMIRRIVRGESPFLTSKEIREANSRDGLNLVCWDNWVRPGYEVHGDLNRSMMSVFIETHRGYLWKELISSQIHSPEQLGYVFKTGGYFWDPFAGAYTSTLTKTPGEILASPHVLGMTRELDAERGTWSGSWVGNLFDYHPPNLGLSRGEQRMLSIALPGATDETLAERMNISLSAVKKVWISIYRRVEESLPELVPDSDQMEFPVSVRGREKRRSVLAYLREHPEELRPFSRSGARVRGVAS